MYIMHRPSAFGMGSDTDVMLTDMKTLRKILRLEHRVISRRLSFEKKKFCTLKEYMKTEPEKMLSECSTYADVNDLSLRISDPAVHVRSEIQ